MSAATVILALVSLQRLGELLWSRRNTARSLARGAVEHGAAHYPFLVLVHASWLISLWIFGRNQPVSPLPLGAFLSLQGARAWVLSSLGPRFTTRIIVLPGAPLVVSGPYRYLSHPNYMIVAGEIALLPLALNLLHLALVFSAVNAIALWVRIHVETRALAQAAACPAASRRP